MTMVEPTEEIQFEAEFDAGLYYNNANRYLHILITSKKWSKDNNIYKKSKEFKADLVILDYDEAGEVIGVEIITSNAKDGDLIGDR